MSTSSPTPSHLLNLPIENITSILSFVTLFELIPLAQVCKYFHSIILPFDDPNHHLDGIPGGGSIDSDPSDYTMWRFVAYCHFEKPFIDLGRKKKRVERVSNFQLKYNNVNLKRIGHIIEKTAPFWYSLVIDFDGNRCVATDFMYLLYLRKEQRTRYSNLKIITVNHVDSASADVLAKILAFCPSVEELTLNHACILDLEIVAINKKTFKTLKKLTINSTENMLCAPEKGYSQPTTIDNNFQKLEELCITGICIEDLKKNNHTLFNSPMLKKVVFKRCNLELNWLTSITPHNIEYLEIRECIGMNSSFIDLILEMKNLKTLIVDVVRKRKFSNNRQFIEEHSEIDFNEGTYDSVILSDTCLKRIVTELVHLSFLDITCNMSQVKGEFLQSIRKALNLNHLALESTDTMHMIDYLTENKSITTLRNTSVQYLFLYGDPKFSSDEKLCEELILPYFSSEDIKIFTIDEIASRSNRSNWLTTFDVDFEQQ